MVRARVVATASALLVLMTVTSGCSWRLEAPEPTWPSPDATTLERDAAAEREQHVIDAIDGAGPAAIDPVIAREEGADAPVRLEALGGVYVAYPDSTASASPAPALAPDTAVVDARDGHLAQALTVDDENLSFLLASAGLSHALTVWYATWVADAAAADVPRVDERALPSPSMPHATLTPTATTMDARVLATLALQHDRARYAYEVLAARAVEAERDDWLARRDIHAGRAAALLALPGVEDLTATVYEVPVAAMTPTSARTQLASDLEVGLGESYAALLAGGGEDVPWLLNAAFDAYAQSATYADGDTFDVPALPGVESGL